MPAVNPGERIRAARESRGLTQEVVAERMSHALGRPVRQAEISRWESGGRVPSAATLRIIEQVLQSESPA